MQHRRIYALASGGGVIFTEVWHCQYRSLLQAIRQAGRLPCSGPLRSRPQSRIGVSSGLGSNGSRGRAQIHWFSIINSCVTVLLLTGFLATILMRVLKNDFVRFGNDEETGASPCAPRGAGLASCCCYKSAITSL